MDNFLLNILSGQQLGANPTASIVVAIVLLWSIAIKGVALYHAARRDEKFWFVGLLFINSIGILEIAYLFFFAKDKLTLPAVVKDLKKLIARPK